MNMNVCFPAQLRRLQEEIENLRKEKENEISTTRSELVSAQNEILSLQKVAEKAASERDTDISTLQAELQTVRAELERWRKDASDYEKEIVNLQASFKLKCQQCEEQQKEEASRLKGTCLKGCHRALLTEHPAQCGECQLLESPFVCPLVVIFRVCGYSHTCMCVCTEAHSVRKDVLHASLNSYCQLCLN